MRLILLLTIVATLQSSAAGWAQNVTINLRNSSLEKVFHEMRKQTGYQFVYNVQMLEKAPRVTLNLTNVPLEQALRVTLARYPLTYTIVDSSVVIKPVKNSPPTVELPAIQIAASDNINVSGVVRSSEGGPIQAVSILIKGTNTGTTTDKDGRFEMRGVDPNATLVFSAVGYTAKEVKLSATTTVLNIELKPAESKMAEVVVTGYQNVDRKLFTGATSKVNAKEAERNGVPDVSRMLEGQVAGVSVQNVSGTFGAAPKIRVRGATSLSGENKPLWVVDGIILEDVVNISNEALSTGDANTLIGSSVAGINPDDIESFTILKDAAATAMYGARAMNGVIVVNTKKGRNTNGKPQINYSGTFTTYLKPSYKQFDIMNSADQLSVLMELEGKGYYNHSSVSRGKDGGIFYKMYNQMYELDETTGEFKQRNDFPSKLKFLERYAKANTDWFDILFRNSLLQEHSLSINSGSTNSQTYFSTSLMKDNGMTLGDKVSRYTAKFRNNFRLNEKLRGEVLVNGSIRDQRTPGTLTRNSDPVFGVYSRDFDINPYSYALNTSRLMTAYDQNGDPEYFVRNYAPFNIINELNTNYLTLKGLDLQVQMGVKYKILPKLEYSIDGAFRYASNTRHHYVLEGSNMAESFRANYDATIAEGNINLYTDPDLPNSLPTVVLPEGGFFNTTIDNLKNFYFRQNLEYDNTWKDIHRFNFFGSMEVRSTDRQNSSYEGIGYQYENGGLVNPNYRYFKKMIEGGDPYFGMYNTKDRFAAFMGRAAYSYDDRYSVNGTFRYDGSNKMGKSRVARWLPTWNLSGAWHIDNERFYGRNTRLSRVLTGATIRGTYGMTASIGNASNSAAVFYNRVTYRPYETEKESGIFLSGLENSQLTWEKMYELNIGTDLSLFNKIDLTIDWYKRNSFDLIGNLNTSGIGGQFVKVANYADMKAQGFEFTIAGNPVNIKNGFRWRTQFNFAVNKNEITNLEINPNIWANVRAEGGMRQGNSQRGLYSIPFAGLDGIYGYPVYYAPDGKSTTPYIRLQDEDKNYTVYHGPTDPTLTGGFYNHFSYKGFSISTLVTFSAGNYVRLQPVFAAQYSDMYTMSNRMFDRFLNPGDEKRTNIPSLVGVYHVSNGITNNGSVVAGAYPYNAYNYSNQAVAKGDFVRLKRISLDYEIPAKMLSRMGLRSLQFSLVGNNIALLYSDKNLYGADPEFFGNGGVALPIPKQYTLAIKLGI